jgi:glycosyltransferase involved in cell wall biosynthesis
MNIEFFHFLKKEKGRGNTGWYELLEKTDVFVLPSRDPSETFSLSAAEAMARGCKLVVTRCSGIAAKLQDGYDAFIADQQNPASLKIQIAKALHTSDDVRVRAYSTAKKEFDLRRMLQQYEDLILRT